MVMMGALIPRFMCADGSGKLLAPASAIMFYADVPEAILGGSAAKNQIDKSVFF